MSEQHTQPVPQPGDPSVDPASAWWRKPAVAVAGVVAVVGLTGGIAAAATSGDPAATSTDSRQGQFPGGSSGEGFGGRGGFPAGGTAPQGGAPGAGGQGSAGQASAGQGPAQGPDGSGTISAT